MTLLYIDRHYRSRPLVAVAAFMCALTDGPEQQRWYATLVDEAFDQRVEVRA